MNATGQRTCRECGEVYTDVFFEQSGVSKNSYLPKRAICIGCRQTARDAAKRDKRPLKKAQAAILTHTPKLIAKGWITSADELTTKYGWVADEMARDIERTFADHCPYCLESFGTMAHGLGDVTLDIVDPTRAPYYKTNVRWVCITCNRAKGRTSPDIWAERLVMWARWKKRQEWIRTRPRYQQSSMFQ